MMNFKKGQAVQAIAFVEAHIEGWDDPSNFLDGQRFTDRLRTTGHTVALARSPAVEMQQEEQEREYPPKRKCLYRVFFHSPIVGIVVGESYRATGIYHPSEMEEDFAGHIWWTEPSLDEDKRHKVIMVQPTHTNRWLQPYPCLEEDLVLLVAEEIP
jgi:hypothetical protein